MKSGDFTLHSGFVVSEAADGKLARLIALANVERAMSWLGALVRYLDTPRTRRALAGDAAALDHTIRTWPRHTEPIDGWWFSAPGEEPPPILLTNLRAELDGLDVEIAQTRKDMREAREALAIRVKKWARHLNWLRGERNRVVAEIKRASMRARGRA